MHMPCKCSQISGSDELLQSPTPAVTTISFSHIETLSALGTAALRAAAPAAKADAAIRQVHTTSDGGLFTTSAVASDLQGHVDLRGTIGILPIELSLTVKLEGDEVKVTLEVTKPIHMGPFEWHFKLGGILRDAQGNITGAHSIALSPATPPFTEAAIGGDFLCFLNCAGLAILPILLSCLGSLIGGPQAFIACVVGKAGEGAAGIAACVAKCAHR